MNDILLPIAQNRRVSVTRCHETTQRILQHRRSTRILYISDFDPGGQHMPVAVARKIEFLISQCGEDRDIQLIPLLLTADQVRQYNLPRAPIRDEVREKAKFEKQHGEGAVELDALEALHPGELARIVNRAIDRYRDETIQRRINEAAVPVRRQMNKVREEVLEQHAEDIAAFELARESAQDAVRQHLEAISEILDQLKERAEPLWQSIANDLEAAAPNLDSIEWPEPEPADEFEDPLYDSRRDYLTQIDRYREHQGKPNGGGRRGNGGAS
jgi:hypothetical protein